MGIHTIAERVESSQVLARSASWASASRRVPHRRAQADRPVPVRAVAHLGLPAPGAAVSGKIPYGVYLYHLVVRIGVRSWALGRLAGTRRDI